MVERKVKLMSVQASPVVKKIAMVLAIALGCDQKNASIQPARAPISHNESTPTRMPTCAAMSAQVGQSFCTGRRRTRAAGAVAAAVSARARFEALAGGVAREIVLNRHRSLLPLGAQAACVDGSDARRVHVQQLEAAFLDCQELAA